MLFFPCYSYTKSRKTLRLPKVILKPSFGLDNAVETAYQNRSSLAARKHRIRVAKNNALAQLSGYLPQAHVRTVLTKSVQSVFPPSQTQIDFSQLLLNFAGPIGEYLIARQDTHIAEIGELLEQDLIRFQVESGFLDFWNITHKEKTIALLEQAAEKQFQKAHNQDRVGLLSITQWHDEKALFAEDMSTVLSYEDERNRKQAIFEHAIEQTLLPPLHTQSTLNFLSDALEDAAIHSVDYYQVQAMQHRKELGIKDQEIIQEEYRKDFFERSYLPSVSLFTTINNGQISTFIDGQNAIKTFWQVGFSVDWDFDGLGNAHRASAADAAVTAKMMEKYDVINTINLEVQTTFYERQELRKQLDAAKVRLEESESTYRLQKKQYEIGDISAVALAAAEQAWEQAQFDFQDLKVKTVIKERELQFRCGYPDNDYINNGNLKSRLGY